MSDTQVMLMVLAIIAVAVACRRPLLERVRDWSLERHLERLTHLAAAGRQDTELRHMASFKAFESWVAEAREHFVKGLLDQADSSIARAVMCLSRLSEGQHRRLLNRADCTSTIALETGKNAADDPSCRIM